MYQKYEAMPEADLLVEIGRELDRDGLDAVPRPVEYFRKRGQEFVDSRMDEIRRLVCHSDQIRMLTTQGFSSELVATIVGLLESMMLGTAASPLAILLCKSGISRLCESVWNEE